MSDETLPVPVPLPQLSTVDLAKLARAVAQDINGLVTTLGEFHLTEAQYAEVQKIEFYKKTLEVEVIQWQSTLNTADRAKLESAVCYEELLPKLFARCQKDDEPLNHVVEAAKLIAKVAGLGERSETSQTPGEKFVINIDFGDRKIEVVKDATLDLSASAPSGDELLPATVGPPKDP